MKHEWNYNCLRVAMNVMFTKMSVNKRIKLFKEHAVSAIVKEYTKPKNMNIVGPKHDDVFTPK